MASVAIHPGLFTLPDEPDGPRLLAGRCSGCAQLHFPAGDACPYCGRTPCATEPVGSTGTLSLYTVVNARPPGYRGPVPYGFGVVDLPEGLRVVTRLEETRLDKLRTGLPVELRIAPLFTNDAGEEVLSFSYAPSAEQR
jgi:scaffold protein (connect acetoacetyl-CoA thiolase and HMG-CoA synthase)